MANRHGFPIWCELMTPDSDGAANFYAAVAGWTIAPPPPGGPDYRMLSAPDGAMVGGMLALDDAMKAGGAKPAWLPYFGVDDVDAAAGKAGTLGANTIVPPTDIPGIGRFALLVDPQGATFYLMRGSSDGESTSFAPDQPGHVGWNELVTTDRAGALAFYGELLGIENRETMDMGPAGGYHFLDLGETRLGAMVEMKDRTPAWRLYVAVADTDAAIAAAKAAGGTIDMGPYPTPRGEMIAIGTDPQGAEFAIVGPGKPA